MQERANEECCCDSSPFSGENGDGGGDGYVGRAEDILYYGYSFLGCL